ncbi:hypothetical protein AB0L53_34880 [Nonomuraea sp. NPDC052129]|uniref:hypothetical protein n=1 Tax=Nonomuraea sp. NPDC052129 TaxID=3154651 RepID=UPI0034463834
MAEWSERTGIAVETWALPSTDVPSGVAAGILAATREALSNVETHSRAKLVSVAVTSGKSGLRLTIRDHGDSFATLRAGRGIARMQATFTELGGSLSVTGTQGEGTTVSGVLPS